MEEVNKLNIEDSSDLSEQNHEPSWIEKLEMMRENRKEDKIESVGRSVESEGVEVKSVIDQKSKSKIYEYYLHQWENDHNMKLSHTQLGHEKQILLVDDWMHESEKILKRDTIFENISQHTIKIEDLDQKIEAQQNQNEPDLFNEAFSEEFSIEELAHGGEATYSITIVKPTFTQNPVRIIDEAQFIKQLEEKIIPHIQDSILGSFKTLLYQYNEQLIYQTREKMETEISKLINEVFDYNIKKLLK